MTNLLHSNKILKIQNEEIRKQQFHWTESKTQQENDFFVINYENLFFI